MLVAIWPLLAIAAALNLNWLRQSSWGHIDARETLRYKYRSKTLAQVFAKLNDVFQTATPCDACVFTLNTIKHQLLKDPNSFSALFYGLCSPRGPNNPLFHQFCENEHFYSATKEGFSFLPDFANALRELDPYDVDGQYLCHYMFSNACPRPPTPAIDYSQWWPPLPLGSTALADPDVRRAQRANQTIRVLHISDVHLSANYSENSAANCLGAMCCEDVSLPDPLEPSVRAPRFGHWRCDCPPALLDSSIRNSAAQGQYAFALFTGDMVDHNPVFITQEETFNEEIRTMRSFKRFLNHIPVYPVLGNHDSYPYSQEPSRDSPYANRTQLNIELMQHMWSQYDWIDEKAAEEVELTHGGYAVEPVPGLKVITLNSNYWYRWNFYNYIGMRDPDPSHMIQFLIDELVDCEERGLKAWIQAHVPPGGLADEALPPAASLLAATLERFSYLITGQFFGHTHLDEFIVLYGNNATERTEQNALNAAWIAPSITPYTDLNSGYRYYDVDANTFEIMDAVTMYADIEESFGVPWDETPDLVWKQLYSTRQTYETDLAWPKSEPLDGRFWHRAAAEFRYNTDFARAFVKRSFRASSKAPDCSSYDCRAERYCYSTSFTPDQVIDCHERYDAGQRFRGSSTPEKFSHRMYNDDGTQRPLHGSNTFMGIPHFPMPRPVRYLRGGSHRG